MIYLRQKHQFGIFLETIYQKEAVLKLFTGWTVLKLFTGGSIFICIASKVEAQFNGELTSDIDLLCQKLYAMNFYTCSDATTFGQAMTVLTALDSA